MSTSKASPNKNVMPAKTKLEERFAAITTKMGSLDLAIDPTQPDSLIRAEAQLGDIMNDLECFVNENLLDEDSEQAKALLGDVNVLLTQTKILQEHISRQIKSQQSSKSISISSNDFGNNNRNSEEEDLKRDEIAKLLLLVSRAFGIKQISPEQRNFLKTEIVSKKGYLRKVVQQEDIGQVLAMLSAISKGK